MYDAVIVGARCAGAPTALLLARKGYRVLLADRADFPSDTLSTHYIHQPGVASLKRWGLLERLVATGCPPAGPLRFDVGPFALTGSPPPADGIADAYAPRRTVLDAMLVEAAAAAGAEVRTRFPVDALVFEGDAVTGIRSGNVTERARVVVGADGRGSLVARAVDAAAYEARTGRTCAYYSYWSGVPGDTVELHPRDGLMVMGGAPTTDGLALAIVFWPRTAFHAVRADVERSFTAALALAPTLAERLAAGERAGRFYGTGSLPFYYRKPFGAGWALVGDAGYHKDPITAVGITDAFRDAELLAEALDAGFSGERPLADALADYERARKEASGPLYELTYELAALAPPSPEQQALFEAVRRDQEQANRFFGTIAGTVPVADFFAPRNIERIVGAPVPA
ncbi:MAG TPA: NAD(P)/FAD-dependent oxidoreductase [Gaiellaceae bacterium]|nr:NAD(P)/FAD-dependent oxidoreductase [Gaiellaceae bacterium]